MSEASTNILKGFREFDSNGWQRDAGCYLQHNLLHILSSSWAFVEEKIVGVIRKSALGRRGHTGKATVELIDEPIIGAATKRKFPDDAADGVPHDEGNEAIRGRRLRQGVAQFPMQILVPEETREALRQRSEDTGASIRHIILRSLAADGFPVPRLTRRRS